MRRKSITTTAAVTQTYEDTRILTGEKLLIIKPSHTNRVEKYLKRLSWEIEHRGVHLLFVAECIGRSVLPDFWGCSVTIEMVTLFCNVLHVPYMVRRNPGVKVHR